MRRIKLVSTIMAVVIMMNVLGCAFLQDAVRTVIEPVPSGVYKSQVAPLVDALVALYIDKIPEEQREGLLFLITDLKRQAEEQDEVYVFPVIVGFAAQIAFDEITADRALSPEEAQLALMGLEVLKNITNGADAKGSLLIESVYPVLHKRFSHYLHVSKEGQGYANQDEGTQDSGGDFGSAAGG